MIVVLGAFGKTGRVVSALVRTEGCRAVRMVTRSPSRKSTERGVEVAVAELSDEDAVRRALKGASGLYAILPDDFGAAQFHAERRAMAAAVARAVARERVPRVVLLSSCTAALGEQGGNGFGADLAYFERLMLDTGAAVTVLRACYFQDNVLSAVPFAEERSTLQCFFTSRDTWIATIAAVDVGAIAARALLDPPPANSEIVDLVGPSYSSTEMAAVLGDALRRKLTIVEVPREEQESMLRRWMAPEAARAMFETFECIGSGRIPLRGQRTIRAQTRLEQVLRVALSRGTEEAGTVHP